MPMDRTKYPANWDDISRSIKEQADWRCEECGVEHGSYILRSSAKKADWRYATEADMVDWSNQEIHLTHIVLTVHHIGVDKPDGSPGDPADKMDCRPENLIALCQRCHLLADQVSHMKAASITRGRKRDEQQVKAGQGELFS